MSQVTRDEFFRVFPIQRTSSTALEDELASSPAALDILFLWGRDCVNCDIAKAAILAAPARFQWADVRWLHTDVYADADMATRFGLHGIPVFFVFRKGKKLGRITEWPGADTFVEAIEKALV